MAAILKWDQVGLPAGTPGNSRDDGLDNGAVITMSSTGAGAVHALELLWVPDDDVSAEASFASASFTSWTMTPQAGRYGTYIARLTVDGEVTEHSFSILTPNFQLRIPGLNERASRIANLVSAASPATKVALLKASTHNTPDVANPAFTLGDYGGWYSAIRKLFLVVDAWIAAPHAATHGPQLGSDPILTGNAGPIAIGDSAATGSANTVARSDHRHALAAPGAPATQVAGSGNVGVATAPARADHVHPMGALAPDDHAATHLPSGSDPLTTAVAGAILIGDAAAEGVAESFARSDHKHSLADPAPPATQVVGAGTEGAATGPARADHVHPMSALAPAAHASTHLPGGSDALTTAVAGAIAIADTALVGTDASFARSDHRHALAAPGTPANQVVGVGAAGASTKVAREDHVHPMSATDAVDVVYGPTAPGDWYATDPVNVEEALDRLAKLRALTIPTFAAAMTFDFSDDKNWQKVTLTANMTSIAFTAPRQIGTVVLEFVQDGTGGWTVAGWPATTRWAGGVKPTFGDAAGTTRLVTAWYDGTNYFCEFRPETYIA